MRSVLEQQGDFTLEYIIIDGGSTDGSVEIIKRFAQSDARVQWVSESDHGQSDAINKGLRRATGEVIAFLNSDDIYFPGTLQAVAERFQQPAVQWAYGRCKIINIQDQETTTLVTWYKNILGYWYQRWLLLVVNYISQPAVFWRRSLLQQVGELNPSEHLVMDYDLWCRFAQQAPATPMRRYLAGFRLYPTSKSGHRYKQQFAQEYQVAKRYTRNALLLALHRLHATLIVLVYRFTR